jgi:hypothetical protein
MSTLNMVFRIYVIAAALPVLGLIIILLVDSYTHKKRQETSKLGHAHTR